MDQNQSKYPLKPLSKRKFYLINVLAFIYLLFCIAISIYIFFFWKVSMIIKIIVLLIVEITVPDLQDIFQSYAKYKKEFENNFKKYNNSKYAKGKVKLFGNIDFLIIRLINIFPEFLKRKGQKSKL